MPRTKQQFFCVFSSPLPHPYSELSALSNDVNRGNKSFWGWGTDIVTAILSYDWFPISWLYAIDFRSPDEFTSIATSDEIRFVLMHEQGASLLFITREGLSAWLSLQVFPHITPDRLIIKGQRVVDIPYYPDRVDYKEKPIKYTNIGRKMAFSPYIIARAPALSSETACRAGSRLIAEYVTCVLGNTLSDKEYHGYGKIPKAVIMGYVSSPRDNSCFWRGEIITEGSITLTHCHTSVPEPLSPEQTSSYSVPACALIRHTWVEIDFRGIKYKAFLVTNDFFFVDHDVDLPTETLLSKVAGLVIQKTKTLENDKTDKRGIER